MQARTGVILVAVAGLIWSTQGLIIRQIDSTDTWRILFWRSAGTVPVLFAFITLGAGGRPRGAIRRAGLAGLIGGAGLVLAFAGSIHAMQSTTIANAVFLFSASPFLAAVLGWVILREAVPRATWAAIALGGLGMFVMVRDGLSGGALEGNLAALTSALGFAAFTVALRHGRVTDMLPAVLLGALMSMAVALAATGGSIGLSLRDAVLAMGLGAVIVGLGLVLYTRGSTALRAADLTLLSQIEVLLAPLWVYLAFGESASTATFLGGAILLAAVVWNGLSGARARAA